MTGSVEGASLPSIRIVFLFPPVNMVKPRLRKLVTSKNKPRKIIIVAKIARTFRVFGLIMLHLFDIVRVSRTITFLENLL